MLGHHFYNEGFERAITLFGTLFNDVAITRDGGQQLVKVPITFGPREKYLEALRELPADQVAPHAVTLPQMSFDLVAFDYDSGRHLSTNQKYVKSDSEGGKTHYSYVYTPVPYNLEFEVTVYAKNEKDCFKVVEQILPYFTPDWTVTAAIFPPNPDLLIDVPVTRTVASREDLYEDSFKRLRAVTYTLGFTVQWLFFGPQDRAKIIKLANTNFFVDTFQSPTAARTVITPGLTEDGQPTSNAEVAIPYLDVNEDDPYGYVVVHTDDPQ